MWGEHRDPLAQRGQAALAAAEPSPSVQCVGVQGFTHPAAPRGLELPVLPAPGIVPNMCLKAPFSSVHQHSCPGHTPLGPGTRCLLGKGSKEVLI